MFQDSFTCMRSEDMVITCEESANYFDLNGNFGLPVDEQSEASATEKFTPEDVSMKESPNPISTDADKITNQKVTEINKPKKSEVYQRKPIRNTLKPSEKVKNGSSNSEIKQDEDHTKVITKIEKTAEAQNVGNKETISNIEIQALKDKSSEADIVSAFIHSLANDFDPTDDDDQKLNEEEANNFGEKIEDLSLVPKQEVGTDTPFLSNDIHLDENMKKATADIKSPLSIDDVIGLVKDSLDNNLKTSNIEETTEKIKPIYQRNEGTTNDNSKIIVITKTHEGVESLAPDSTNSKIIPLEIKEPSTENLDSFKTKSRRYLKLSSRV